MSDKQKVIDLVTGLPDDMSWDAILEEIAILAAVERSERQLAAGNWVSHEDIETRAATWVAK